MAVWTIAKGEDASIKMIFGADIYGYIFNANEWNVYAEVRLRGASDIVLEMSTDDGNIQASLLDPRALTIDLGASVTDALAVGVYEFDLRWVNKTTEETRRSPPAGTEPFTITVTNFSTTDTDTGA